MNAFLEFLNQPPAIVWPLILFACLLLALRQLRAEVEPIVKAVITGLAKQAANNSQFFAVCFALGISSTLSAVNEVCRDLTAEKAAALSYYQMLSLFAQVANPFLVTVLAYVVPKNVPRSTGTTPPFPSAPNGS